MIWNLARHSESTWDVGPPTALRGTSGTTTAIVREIQGKCARALRKGSGQADFLAEFGELLADLDKFLEAKGYKDYHPPVRKPRGTTELR